MIPPNCKRPLQEQQEGHSGVSLLSPDQTLLASQQELGAADGSRQTEVRGSYQQAGSSSCVCRGNVRSVIAFATVLTPRTPSCCLHTHALIPSATNSLRPCQTMSSWFGSGMPLGPCLSLKMHAQTCQAWSSPAAPTPMRRRPLVPLT